MDNIDLGIFSLFGSGQVASWRTFTIEFGSLRGMHFQRNDFFLHSSYTL